MRPGQRERKEFEATGHPSTPTLLEVASRRSWRLPMIASFDVARGAVIQKGAASH